MPLTTALHRLALGLAATGSLLPGLVGASPAWPPPAPVTPVATTRLPVPDTGVLRRTWSWPLEPRPAVEAPFVAPRSTYGAGHRGMDLVARQGQEVLAVDAGIVSHVGVVAGRGTVSVTHASGLRSTYQPVRGSVSTGSTVAEGESIGSVAGRTHCGGSCLHLGARRGTGYVDPRPLLGGGPVILLPLGPSG